jgi:hypothetical protein
MLITKKLGQKRELCQQVVDITTGLANEIMGMSFPVANASTA